MAKLSNINKVEYDELLHDMSINYAIDESLIAKYHEMSVMLNLHIYDIVTLYNIYVTDDEVIKHASNYSFENKFLNWYDGKYRMPAGDMLRPAAAHFDKYNVYTLSTPNRHPNSEFIRFWKEEARRSLYGYHTGTDWISGYNYFYNNYSRIITLKMITRTRAERIESFPNIWDSDYFYFHYIEECERTGKDAAVLKCRGRGYSFKGGSMLNRNYFLIPNSKSMILVADKKHLIGDGTLDKAWQMMTFIDENTAWSKRRSKKSTDLHRRASMEVSIGGVKHEEGFMSEIMGISIGDDPSKARGKRNKLIEYEEAGSFANLMEAWSVNEASVRQGRISFGLRIAFGTGGEEGSGFEGLKELFFKSEANNILSVPDVWNYNSRNVRVGFFIPTYVNLEGHYDKDGNSDMESARKEIEEDRNLMMKHGADNMTIARKKAEFPLTPQDAILRTEGSPFPIIDLREHLADVQNKSIYKGVVSVGNLVIETNGDIRWKEDLTGKLKPIVNLRTTEQNREGCIQIFRHPERNENGQVVEGLYIAGTDPIDFDIDEVTDRYSLGSTFIMNALTEQIVAEYTGRPNRAEEYYENVRRLCIYYNCRVMYENNLKGMYVYFSNKHCEHLLADKPKILEDTLQFVSKANRKKGYTASAKVNALGRDWIAKWLNTDWLVDNKELRMLHTIISEGLLEELISWYKDGNFDRVSALIALMIYKSDIYKITEKIIERKERLKEPFWKKALRSQN